ncbi:glutaredoxin [Chryseotalea sanaruensis]|uniref:Glutaredoxin n=1 Tax=Chryseotalea sanaruensis TaxID=2482724 RepID=A0A401U570_9BACT|nr:ArsC/Spx/MgsR family protein [Chryseotalea sanaruensis]GCC50005.1 glutaredoxin [Chryseotalea sanaruensis]
MQFHPNELFLLYNPQSNSGKQTKAMAKDICSNINEIDALHEKLIPTYWKEVVTMLGISPAELLDKSHPDYASKVGENSYTMEGWLEVLARNPQLLKAPIAIYNKRAIFCETPTDIMKLAVTAKAGEKILPHLRGNA